jgi:hypothetical protein
LEEIFSGRSLTDVPILFYEDKMPLDPAIERQRKPLLRIVVTLFAMIGLAEGAAVERLTPQLYRAVLRVLRPAESAVRRLIVVAARGLTLKPPSPRNTSRKASLPQKHERRGFTFRLFDPRPRFNSAIITGTRRQRIRITPVRRPEPRIRLLGDGFDPRVPLFRMAPPAPPIVAEAPVDDGSVSALRLSRRLYAVKQALEDLPKQARRYLRWQAKPAEMRRPQFSSALRRGEPPGHRKKPRHRVDEILAECDWLARRVPLSDSS